MTQTFINICVAKFKFFRFNLKLKKQLPPSTTITICFCQSSAEPEQKALIHTSISENFWKRDRFADVIDVACPSWFCLS